MTTVTTNNTQMSIPWYEYLRDPLGHSSTLSDNKKCLCGGKADRSNHQFTKKHQTFLVTTKRYSWKLVNFNGTLYYHSDICPNTLYIGIKTDEYSPILRTFCYGYDGIPDYVDILLESKKLDESLFTNEWDIDNIKKYFYHGGMSDPDRVKAVPLSPLAHSIVVDRVISRNISIQNNTSDNKLYLYPYQGKYYYTQKCEDKTIWYDQEQRYIYDPREEIPPLYKEDFPPLP